MDQLLTPRELSEILKVSEDTLRRWRKQGTGPSYVKLGGRMVRYPEKEVREFLKRKEVVTTWHSSERGNTRRVKLRGKSSIKGSRRSIDEVLGQSLQERRGEC